MTTVQVGPPGTGDPIRDGIGCVLFAVGVAIVLWALWGFPGLTR